MLSGALVPLPFQCNFFSHKTCKSDFEGAQGTTLGKRNFLFIVMLVEVLHRMLLEFTCEFHSLKHPTSYHAYFSSIISFLADTFLSLASQTYSNYILLVIWSQFLSTDITTFLKRRVWKNSATHKINDGIGCSITTSHLSYFNSFHSTDS